MNTDRNSDAAVDVGGSRAPENRAAAAHILARLCLPAQMSVRLPAGELIVHPRLVERAAAAGLREVGDFTAEALALKVEDRPGALVIDRGIALVVVNAVVDLPPPPFAGALSRIERGVLEGTVAGLLPRLGPPGRIRLCGQTPFPLTAGMFAFELSLGFRGHTGYAWLLTDDEAVAGMLTSAHTLRPHAVPWLELASTRVPASDIASAEPGDIVVFDETTALSPTADWHVRLFWRGNAVAVRWLRRGVVVLRDGAVAESFARSAPDPSGAEPSVHGAMPASIEVSAGKDCPSLFEAVHVPLVLSRAEPIALRVNGRTWAYGSQTEVDGALAVRIAGKAGR